jgi:hypothetical protein
MRREAAEFHNKNGQYYRQRISGAAGANKFSLAAPTKNEGE